MGMFEKAVRMKLRFNHKGLCSVEDLWDLSLENLDTMYGTMNKELEQLQGTSLLRTRKPEEEVIVLKMNIVSHIVSIKLQEKADKEARREKAERKQMLMGILEEKQNAEYRSMSKEDIMKLINDM